ncbi:SusC/RagA family TonB-linked outer membrane protein [Arcticibacter sp. MXS-1]|uniref:SusC/RagA family TonB-linked outer membrane protein n=1 Tax=Arcticibacter sp. MXS-1 TaxID=3341726 RepID=UPI0035A88FE2
MNYYLSTERKRTALFFFLYLFLSMVARGQDITVRGKVTDAQGPLIGVSVKVAGTTKGTLTGPSGEFSISAPPAGTLIFSYIGYVGQRVQIQNRTTVNVTMAAESRSLGEVVVTGYATQRKKDLTGAVAVVDVENLNRQPTANVENQLQGQAAGVTVTGSGQPGEQPQINIRGINTFGNNTPLYVVDGVPTQNITDINPNDISSLQVLKDAGSASVYGSRASNGVIVITTKRGSGKVKVSYDAYVGRQYVQGGNVFDLLNPTEMMQLTQRALANSGLKIENKQYGTGTFTLPDYILGGSAGGLKEGDPAVDPSRYKANPEYNTGVIPSNWYQITKANKQGTDWFHEIFKDAPIQSHNLTVSGGGEQGNYLFSFNYFNQKGTLIRTFNTRYSIRSNSQFNVSKNIRIGENLEYSITENPRANVLDEGSAVGMAFREQPIIPVYDIAGNFAGTRAPDLGNARNPVAIQERTRNNSGRANRLFGNIFAEVDLFRHFTARTSFGGESWNFNRRSFTFPEYENAENNTQNTYRDDANNLYNYTWTNTVNYSQDFDKHHLRALVGTESYRNSGRNLWASRNGYYIFDPDYTNLDVGSSGINNSSNRFDETLFSLIGRVDYNFADKYLIGATIRRDGSSKFGEKHRYGWFPAFSAAWRISQEPFMKGIDWLSDLKIRGGWGVMGNQFNLPANNAYTTFGTSQNNSYYPTTGGNTIIPGYFKNRIGNPDAKWESDKNSNIGIDASLFHGKIEFSGDYYRKDINDMLFNPELPGTQGQATAPYQNIASMFNDGLDLSATGNFRLSKDIKLSATATFTSYHNEIKSVSGNTPYYDVPLSRRFNGNYFVRNAVGQSLGSFFGYKVDGFWDSQAEIDQANAGAQGGVYQNDVKVGRFRYADINKDGRITAEDRTFIGDPNPDFTYGLNLGLDFKNFDFSAFFYGSQGNDIWNNVRWWTDFYGGFTGAKSRTLLYNSWTPENPNAKAPVIESAASFSTQSVPNSYFVENGSYLRLRNVQIGYTLQQSVLNKLKIKKLRIYVSGANLFTITKYSGLDPEIAQSSTGNTNGVYRSDTFGIDEGSYPSPRTFLFGVNASF